MGEDISIYREQILANAKFLYGTNLKYDVIVRVTPDIRYPVYPVFRAYLIAYYDNTPVGQPGEGLILCTHRDANINYFGLAMWCLLQELMTDVRRAMENRNLGVTDRFRSGMAN